MDKQKFFVVVDPNNEKHVALERCLITAQLHEPRPELYIFICVDTEAVDTRASNDNIFRDQTWFEEQIKKPIEALGLEYTIEVSWSSEWRKAIVESAKRFAADTILLPLHKKSSKRRFTFSEEKWGVLKSAHCPVLLVQPGANEQRKKILAAVNFQTTRDVQKELNEMIIARGHWMADAYGADFHVVNAYLDSLNYPDRGKLVHETKLPSDKIHVKQGYSDEVVAQVAKEVGADIVIMGTLGQNGMIKNRRGNTAERVISGLDVDVTVLNHE